MNGNYQSYTIGQDEPQPENIRHAGPQIRDTVVSVSTVDGVITERSAGHERGTTAELNPYHGTDSFGATAQNPNGLPVTELLPTTLVTIDGVQASIQFWMAEGRLSKAADGTYTEAAGIQAAPEADTSDIVSISEQGMSIINAAIDTVEQGNLDGLMAAGMGFAVGRLDAGLLVQKFGQASGYGAEDAAARIAAVQGVYQAQADQALESRSGIGAGDRDAFYAWAREHRQGELQQAVQRQMHAHDVSGYAAIAKQWLSLTPPSMAALKAAGHPVRQQSGKAAEVYLQGSWMTTQAAARAGLV